MPNRKMWDVPAKEILRGSSTNPLDALGRGAYVAGRGIIKGGTKLIGKIKEGIDKRSKKVVDKYRKKKMR